jgi:phosphate transport system permease protein
MSHAFTPAPQPPKSPPAGPPTAPRGKQSLPDVKPPSKALDRSLTYLCGGALAFNLLLVVAIMAVLLVNGAAYFWQRPLVEVELADGQRMMGEIFERQAMPTAEGSPGTAKDAPQRFRMKTGNRDLTGLDFAWVPESDVKTRQVPTDAVMLERLEWGNFYGYLTAVRRGEETLATGREEAWRKFNELHAGKVRERRAITAFEKGPIGAINTEIEALRLRQRRIEISSAPAAEKATASAVVAAELTDREAAYAKLADQLGVMRQELAKETVVATAADGTEKELPIGYVVHALRPNAMSTAAKLGLYASRIVEFVRDDPRESNTEGGIFPAIFGTVMMVFLMSFAVAPLGVIAAVYLREYAKQGLLVRLVRIAVNNLAGVPSIVFGVFGLGFFVYVVGGTIDQLFYPEALPTPTFGTGGILWAALTLALLTVPVVIVAAEEGLAAVPRIVREGSLALGATKFETMWRVVIPAAGPGILTGMILAMARAAGEVAPLMIVGMVKLAPALPVDGAFPFVHLERKFMHLGFHIYDVGFQSPNVEATTPLVFATALLLILVVTAMNLTAIMLRNRLRKKYAGSAV